MIRETILLPEVTRNLRQARSRTRLIPGPEYVVMQQIAALIWEYILARWPVRTGDSADAFRVEPLSMGRLGFIITNTEDYTEYVHLAGQSPDDPLIYQLIDELSAVLPSVVWNMLRPVLSPTRGDQPIAPLRDRLQVISRGVAAGAVVGAATGAVVSQMGPQGTTGGRGV